MLGFRCNYFSLTQMHIRPRYVYKYILLSAQNINTQLGNSVGLPTTRRGQMLGVKNLETNPDEQRHQPSAAQSCNCSQLPVGPVAAQNR
jgi:hypothetical protein